MALCLPFHDKRRNVSRRHETDVQLAATTSSTGFQEGQYLPLVLPRPICSIFYSPALTGSITWGPAPLFIHGTVPIKQIPQFGPSSSLEYYFRYPEVITQIVAAASARANLVWTGSNSIAMKRVLSNADGIRFLHDGTCLDNVTIPYFKVESFDWIKDPNSTLTQKQLQIVSTTDGFSPFFAGNGRTGFIPDDRWGPLNKSNNSTPHQVLETRVLALRSYRGNLSSACDIQGFGDIPPGVGHIVLQSGGHNDCTFFANVTYRACVALCRGCRISSWATVDSEGVDLQPAPDRFVEEALAITPYLSTHLLFGDYATPYFLKPAENRSLELMSRSFQAAWMGPIRSRTMRIVRSRMSQLLWNQPKPTSTCGERIYGACSTSFSCSLDCFSGLSTVCLVACG